MFLWPSGCSIAVDSSHLVHELHREIWNGKPLMGRSMANSGDDSVTSGVELIAPVWTGGSASAFTSFGAVLSFPTSLGKEEKAIPLGGWSHSSVQSLIWRTQLEQPQFYYRLWLSKDGTAQMSGRKRFKKLTSESVWHPNQSLSCLRNFPWHCMFGSNPVCIYVKVAFLSLYDLASKGLQAEFGLDFVFLEAWGSSLPPHSCTC